MTIQGVFVSDFQTSHSDTSGSSSQKKSCSNKKKSVNEVVVKLKIMHVVKISAQLEQLRQRYDCFYWFFEKVLERYASPEC